MAFVVPAYGAQSLQSSTHEGRIYSNPAHMKGTFTRTYGVKVPFMREARGALRRPREGRWWLGVCGRSGRGYASAQGPVATRPVALRPAAASLVTSSAVSAYPVLLSSRDFAKITPYTSPAGESSGPPELPGSTRP